MLRAMTDYKVDNELAGVAYEHICDNGIMFEQPGPHCDEQYLRKFESHLSHPVLPGSQEEADRNAFFASLRKRVNEWHTRQRLLEPAIYNFFHHDLLPGFAVEVQTYMDEEIEQARVTWAGNPALAQAAVSRIALPNPRRLILVA